MEKVRLFFKKNLKWILLFFCLLFVLKVVEILYKNELNDIDLAIYTYISSYISDSLTPIMKVFTTMGSAFVILPVTLGLTLFFWARKETLLGFLIPLNLSIVTFLNIIVKNIVQRPRPSSIALIRETGYSFPSGHSMVSMAFYGFLIYLIHRYMKDKKGNYLVLLFTSLILGIGFSRIYLGVHYVSDVVSGFLLSVSYLIVFTSIFSKKLPKEKKTNIVKPNLE